jgi:NADH:ubiquinone oxidoreductase subunit
MRSWGHFVGLLGPKFWHLYRREGLMRALLRGKPLKYSHEKAGWNEVVRLVGSDEFGNRYYEDFDHHNFNTRRWVEFADYGKWHMTVGKKVGPGWHGWMNYMYDDAPGKQNFVEPYYRPHKTSVLKTDHPTLAYKAPGHNENPNLVENKKLALERQYKSWNPPQGGEKRRGKKIIVAE